MSIIKLYSFLKTSVSESEYTEKYHLRVVFFMVAFCYHSAMSKPSTEPYKGVRDFYPEDQFIQNYIFSIWRDTAESYGYQEYNASLLEATDLYTAKTSEEIINEQTYTFTDRGDRSVTLRPEMTPSVARMIARKRRELPFPLRWFSIGNMFRYERPQRGRLREHWQLNADIFGVDTLQADIEILTLAHGIMTAFGAIERDFEIRINNRATLKETLISSGLSENEAEEELSRMDKGSGSKNVDIIEPSDDVKEIIKIFKDRGINNIVYDQNLVRGFSYYTGIVFEVFDTDKNNTRSLFGGGRYDDLVEKFGSDDVPAVGFGLGDVRMRDFLEVHGLIPEHTSTTDLYICVTDSKHHEHALTLAKKLRAEGISVAVDMSGKRVGDQISLADKKRIPYIVCIGDDEVSQEKYTVKELSSGKESNATENEIAIIVLQNLGMLD